MHARRSLSLAFAMLGLASQAQAQPYVAVVGDTPALRYEVGPEEIDHQHFGAAVAISDDGSRVVVGAPDYTVGPVPVGGALGGGRFRIFRRTGTTWAEELAFVSGNAQEELGTSVAMNGDGSVVVIGAPGATSFSGRAHVYRRTGTTWAADGFLVPSGLVSNDRAGTTVAISADGTYALVGVPYDDNARGTDAGQVVVFAHGSAGWAQQATILPSAGNGASLFGSSLALATGTPLTLAVGAPGDVLPGGAQGAAYVFVRLGPTWAENARLLDPAGAAGDGLGWSVAIDAGATRIAVGAPGAAVAGPSGDGKVLHFEFFAGWRYVETLTAPSRGEQFGTSIGMSSDARRLLVGAPRFSTPTATTGTAHLYLLRASAFVADVSFGPLDAADTDEVARALAYSRDGSRAVLGVPFDDVSVTDEGTARVFLLTALDGAPCGIGLQCGSGFCTDGVCCSADCSRGGSTPCQACVRARTGVADGTCAPVNDGTMCAPGTGTCDPADFCNGLSAACPPTFAPATTECRASTGTCDAAENCTGTTGTCPSDARAPNGTSCADGDVCNGAETCVSGACTAGSALACDDADACTAESCDPVTGCAHAPVAGCCNVDADCADATVCNGSETCVAHVCTSGVALVCDDRDVCTTDACDPTTGCTTSVIADCCYEAADCDDGDACTQDTCVDGTIPTCDHVAICDAGGGVDASIALDAGTPAADAGRDASGADGSTVADASVGADAGASAAPAAGGCGCRAGGASGTGNVGVLVLVALVLVGRRRRGHGRATRSTSVA